MNSFAVQDVEAFFVRHPEFRNIKDSAVRRATAQSEMSRNTLIGPAHITHIFGEWAGAVFRKERCAGSADAAAESSA